MIARRRAGLKPSPADSPAFDEDHANPRVTTINLQGIDSAETIHGPR